MRHLLRRRPSAAMVVAVIALVVAASGSAVAASKLTSGDSLIAKRSLSGNRLRNHTVTAKQIKISSLTNVPSAVTANTANTAKSAAISNLTYVSTPATIPAAPNNGSPESATPATATCPTGTNVVSGGDSVADKTGGGAYPLDSYPSSGSSWTAEFFNYNSTPVPATVYAICAPAATTTP